ncbi:MAG TPA: sigma 54-interacting transcriptional regulator [Firmicutes bacterium]|nr:sigma 54-interacting transcriptional regulator [Bacillota bacterium]
MDQRRAHSPTDIPAGAPAHGGGGRPGKGRRPLPHLLRFDLLSPTRFESILQAIEDEIFITDGEGYTIFANRACQKNCGMAAEQLLGKHVLELEREGVYWPTATPLVLRSKKSVTIEQNTLLGRKLVLTGTPIFGPSGQIEMVVCTSRDVTELSRLQRQIEAQRHLLAGYAAQVAQQLDPEGLIYSSTAMRTAIDLARTAAGVDTTVLILGESGVGKDLIARAIHSFGPRARLPFVKINCSAIPESLLESELFGYVSGAFTGARREGKPGLLAAADKGTLFLDEIGDMPLPVQAKLLQAIEDKRFFPVGSAKEVEVNVRVIAATNQDLQQLTREGRFRQDLYYRLNVFTICVPPLRERREDILPLLHYYLQKCNESFGTRRQLSPGAIGHLLDYPWPGNVRELKNVLERLVLTAPGEIIEEDDLPEPIRSAQSSGSAQPKMQLPAAKAHLEAEMIREAYHVYKSSYGVARALGISQSAAARKIRKYVLSPPDG